MSKLMVYIQYENDYDIINKITLIPKSNPNSKELRLALYIIDELFPLYKRIDIESKDEFLRDVFKFTVSKDRLKKLNRHKDLLFKPKITIKNNKVLIKKVKTFNKNFIL